MKKHVSLYFEMYFMIFGWKQVFTIRDEKVCLMGFDQRKSLKFDERMLLFEKFKFSYLEMFFSLKNFDGIKNIENANKIISSLETHK